RFMLSAGPTTRSSLVEYRFEGVGRLDADFLASSWGGLYAFALLRGVLTESKPSLPRDGFLDAHVEGGIDLRRGQRSFKIFAAYEHRNDVYPLVPAVRDWALFGVRFGIADRSR